MKDKNKSDFLLSLTRTSVFQKEIKFWNDLFRVAVWLSTLAALQSLPLWFSCKKLTRMDSVCWQGPPGSVQLVPTARHKMEKWAWSSSPLGDSSAAWIAWNTDRDCGSHIQDCQSVSALTKPQNLQNTHNTPTKQLFSLSGFYFCFSTVLPVLQAGSYKQQVQTLRQNWAPTLHSPLLLAWARMGTRSPAGAWQTDGRWEQACYCLCCPDFQKYQVLSNQRDPQNAKCRSES